MKKKLISILLFASIISNSTACGSNDLETDVAKESTVEAVEQNEEVKEEIKEETDAESVDENKEEATESLSEDVTNEIENSASDETSSSSDTNESGKDDEITKQSDNAPSFLSSTEYIYEADDSDNYNDPLFSGHIEKLVLTDESKMAYPKLDEAVTEFISARGENAKSVANDYIQTNREERKSYTDEDEEFIYTAYVYEDYLIERVDTKCVSIIAANTTYMGGAHGYTGYETVNYDVLTGDEIKLTDVIPDGEAFSEYLCDQLIDKYTEDAFFATEDEGGLQAEIDRYIEPIYNSDSQNEDGYHLIWGMNADGVQIIFNPYEIAPYASGTITAEISYESGLIDKDYIPEDGGTIISQVPDYMSLYSDTNGDGTYEKYDIWGEGDVDYPEDYIHLQVQSESDSLTVEDYFFSYKTYLARSGEKHFIIVDTGTYNDYHVLYCFEIEDGKIVRKDNLPCDSLGSYYDSVEDDYYTYCLTDSSAMCLATRMDILSSYSGNKIYALDTDGNTLSEDSFYDVYMQYALITKIEFETDVVDENGDVVSRETFPAGTDFTIIRTDGESIVDTITKDGTIARFTIEPAGENSFYPNIDGVSADQIFETLYYAG
ncbi:MAG: DUF3298 and DUF4163 domain-containing protein [Butyrivibrio sp.]|nr:DUF3298 and DUF4163 domain-containing protein [Butyrivibrio sp.]